MYGATKKAMIFRKHKSTGEVSALILEGDYFTSPVKMLCLNQFKTINEIAVDYSTTLLSTEPCKGIEIDSLLQALQDSDYRVRIINKRQKR